MSFKFEIQERIGRYPVEREIGRGATSRVYLGRDPDADDRPVAIKVFFNQDEQPDQDPRLLRKAFMAEAALAGRLSHPHICEILDAVSEPHYRYVVMEYVEGGTLEHHCEVDTLLPVSKVIEIVFKCIRALDYAFQRGVIHRDIKPGNILLGPRGDIKVSDFGASFQDSEVNETTQLMGIGSPAYMSPEQIRMEPLNHQTDIYSLGVVLYKLLTGRLPYNASNQLSLTYEILNVQPVPPSAFRPELPAVLDQICLKAMDKELANRFQTWVDFGKELTRTFTALRSLNSSLSDSEKIASLRTLPFFSSFDDVVLWEALRIGTWHEVQSGRVMMTEGDIGDSFFVLVSGSVSVTLQGMLLATVESGGCFGEMVYFRDPEAPRTTSITALTRLSVLEIRATVLRHASEACQNAFQRAFICVLIDRLTHANRRIAGLTGEPQLPETHPA